MTPLAQHPLRLPDLLGAGLSLAAFGATAWVESDPYDLLWVCHVGSLILALGLLTRSAHLTATAFLWTGFGVALWSLDVLNGGPVGPLTVSVHFGALALAVWGARRRGWPVRLLGWQVILGILALQFVCRYVTPETQNINLAHRIRSGWEPGFSSYASHWLFTVGAGSIWIVVLEEGARRMFPRLGAPVAPPVELVPPSDVAAQDAPDPEVPDVLDSGAERGPGARVDEVLADAEQVS